MTNEPIQPVLGIFGRDHKPHQQGELCTRWKPVETSAKPEMEIICLDCDGTGEIDTIDRKTLPCPTCISREIAAGMYQKTPATPLDVELPPLSAEPADVLLACQQSIAAEGHRRSVPFEWHRQDMNIRERQLLAALDREHKTRVSEAALNESLHEARAKIAELEVEHENPRIGTCVFCQSSVWANQERIEDQRGLYHPICFERSRADRSDAIISELEQTAQELETAGCDAIDRAESSEAKVAELEADLKDPAKVHLNILRGEIALTKEQAIHIAGLPADIEEQLKDKDKEIEKLRAEAISDLNSTEDQLSELSDLAKQMYEALKLDHTVFGRHIAKPWVPIGDCPCVICETGRSAIAAYESQAKDGNQ